MSDENSTLLKAVKILRFLQNFQPPKEAVGLSDGVTAYLLYNGSATYIL